MKQSFKGKKLQRIVVGERLEKCQRPKKKSWRELKIVAKMGLHINGFENYSCFT
jgi:hypothetical protein